MVTIWRVTNDQLTRLQRPVNGLGNYSQLGIASWLFSVNKKAP